MSHVCVKSLSRSLACRVNYRAVSGADAPLALAAHRSQRVGSLGLPEEVLGSRGVGRCVATAEEVGYLEKHYALLDSSSVMGVRLVSTRLMASPSPES